MGSARRKKPLKKGKLVKILVILAIIAAGLFFGVRKMQSRVRERFAGNEQETVQTAQVTKGSIGTTVSGSGTLENEEANDVTIPQNVEVTDVYVEAGDKVAEGDMLASVNTASVVEAMGELQTSIDEIDTQLSEISEDDSEDSISAGVAGRIKKIYAEEDVALADTMYEHQALMRISMDGYMAVDVETDALNEGDSLTVTASDGTEYEGKVDSVWGGKATILITDDGPAYQKSPATNRRAFLV